MQQARLARGFLILCLAASLTVVFFVLQPFITPLIVAAMFAFLFQPLYQAIHRAVKGFDSVAAALTTLVALFLIVLPVALFGTIIFREAVSLQQAFGSDQARMLETIANINAQFHALLPASVNVDALNIQIGEYTKQLAGIVAQNLGAFFSSLAKLLLHVFIFLVSFFFFLKDGPRLKGFFVALSPLDDKNDQFIVSRIESAVSATFKGNLTIALIQGFLTAVGFVIFGVPNAALWGSVAAVMALVPGVGTSLVLLPAIAYLYFTGDVYAAAGLAVWGITAVGLIDNALGPTLVGNGMRLHPLVVFLSVLGGFSFFGPLGFLLGPLSVSICLAFTDIYFALIESDRKVQA